MVLPVYLDFAVFPFSSFDVTSLLREKRSETATVHSFTQVYSDGGCFEASARMCYVFLCSPFSVCVGNTTTM